MSIRGSLVWVLGIAVFVLLNTMGRLLGLYIDWCWFQEVQFTSVFVTILRTEALLGVVSGATCFVLLYGNVTLARWLAPRNAPVAADEMLTLPSPVVLLPRLHRLALPVSILLALLVGWMGAGHWELVLKALHATPFGLRDPLFDQDVAFYVFQLPLWNAIYGWLMGVFFLTSLAVIVVSLCTRSMQVTPGGLIIARQARGLGNCHTGGEGKFFLSSYAPWPVPWLL